MFSWYRYLRRKFPLVAFKRYDKSGGIDILIAGSMPGIEAFLKENNLAFIGFEIDAGILRTYKLRFPDDRAATNLGLWHILENENPGTFR